MGIVSALKTLFNKEDEVREEKGPEENNTTSNQVYEINEEDKVVLALAASIMAAGDEEKSQFHISKITRIS